MVSEVYNEDCMIGTSPILTENQNGSLDYSGYSAASIVGNSRAYLADCMVMLKQTPDKYYDLSVVDPPYGIDFGKFNRTNKTDTGERYKANKYKNGDWDSTVPDSPYFLEL